MAYDSSKGQCRKTLTDKYKLLLTSSQMTVDLLFEANARLVG